MTETQGSQGKHDAEIEQRMRNMKPENVEVLEELLAIVQRQREEEKENRTYKWFEDCDINLWAFRDKHPGMMRGLEEELELEAWLDVAPRLGLSYQQIERCKSSKLNPPAREMFNTLNASPHWRDLTLKTVLEVLRELERHDILRRLQGFDCMKMTERFNSAKTFTLTIQRPKEVLVAAENTGTTTDEAVSKVNGERRKTPSSPRVMIVHASDALDDALKLAKYLKSRGANYLLLQESENSTVRTWLEIDAFSSIHKWFLRVDYIVPVLSPQFLRQIQNLENSTTEKHYNRYVFRMMLDQFVQIGCKNLFCRAVCPGKYLKEVNDNEFARTNPMFYTRWNCSSENHLEEHANIIFSGVETVRKLRKKIKMVEVS